MSRWLTRLRVALRSLVRRSRFERELDEEMRFHLDREIQERMKAGQSEADARRAARRAMGAIESNKEACRDLRDGARLARLTGDLRHDLHFAWRLFRRRPSPVVMAIGGLALAIGVATAAFSLVNASLLRPYAMDDPSSVVSVSRIGEPAWAGLPYAQYLRMHDGATLTVVEAAMPERVRFSTAPAADGLANRPILFVSGGYLRMLGGRPLLGRMLDASDDTPAAPAAIVVSHRFWQTVLDSDPALVGRTVWINDAPATLVGVMRPDFTGPVSTPVSIWATLAAVDDVHGGTPLTPDAKTSVEVVARLRPGSTSWAARAELTAIAHPTPEPGSRAPTDPRSGDVWLQSAASPMDTDSGGDTYAILACVIGIVALILALACANVANLLLAAAMTRAREVGVRLALGASRGRLVRQLISESALLGLIAGAVGVLLAYWMTPILGAVVEMPPEIDLAPDGRVLIFAAVVALVCGVSAGVSPARFGARGNVASALHAAGGSRGAAGIPSRLRTTFVGAQAAMSMLLLVAAVLLGRSAMRMARTDVGFDADRLLAVQFDLRPGPDEVAYIDAARDAVRTIPSVEHVSVIENAPWGCCIERYRATPSFEIHVERADAEFFATAGVRIVRGRGFTSDEVAGGAPVALISENVARTFFRGLDPIGQLLSARVPSDGGRDGPAVVIGVVADALMSRIGSQNAGTIVRPIGRHHDNAPALLVRAASPGLTARLVEDALRRVNDRITPRTSVVQDGLDAFVGGTQRLAWLLAPTALLALVLAALGVYGVTTFVVGQRMDEVSVRLAIGASAADILRLLVADSLRPIVLGLTVGLGAALLVARAFAGELGGISPYDPVSIVIAIATLATCALVAVLVPARRAAKTDPAVLLRHA